MINLKIKKFLLPLIALIALSLNLNIKSVPATFSRFQNIQTGQILDLYSDLHKTNDFILHTDTCNNFLHLVTHLNPENTLFIWELMENPNPKCSMFMNVSGMILKILFPRSFISADLRSFNFSLIYSMNKKLLEPRLFTDNPLFNINLTIKDVINEVLVKSSIIYENDPFAESKLSKKTQETLTRSINSYREAVQKFLQDQSSILNQNLFDYYNAFYLNSLITDKNVTYLDIIFRIKFDKFYNEFTKLFIQTLFEFEVIKNIFSSNKQLIIVNAGVQHCENIKEIIKKNNLEFKCVIDGNEKQILYQVYKR